MTTDSSHHYVTNHHLYNVSWDIRSELIVKNAYIAIARISDPLDHIDEKDVIQIQEGNNIGYNKYPAQFAYLIAFTYEISADPATNFTKADYGGYQFGRTKHV